MNVMKLNEDRAAFLNVKSPLLLIVMWPSCACPLQATEPMLLTFHYYCSHYVGI
jgi:hypothetical protein